MSITHRITYVCLDCRRQYHISSNCLSCNRKLIYVGYKLRIPKKRDKRGWNKLRAIIEYVDEVYGFKYLGYKSVDQIKSFAEIKQMIKDIKRSRNFLTNTIDEKVEKSYNYFNFY